MPDERPILAKFDEWIENLTDEQILFYTAYSEGKKTIDTLGHIG